MALLEEVGLGQHVLRADVHQPPAPVAPGLDRNAVVARGEADIYLRLPTRPQLPSCLRHPDRSDQSSQEYSNIFIPFPTVSKKSLG